MAKAKSFEDKVREILDGLEDEDDFVDAVREQLNYKELVAEVIKDPSVKDMIKKAITAAVKKELDEDENENFIDAIREEIDYTAAVKEALADEKTKEVIRAAVLKGIKDAVAESGGWFDEALQEATQEAINVAEIVKEASKKDNDVRAAIIAAIKEKIAEQFKNGEVDIDDSISEAIDFEEEVRVLMGAQNPELKAAVLEMILRSVRGMNDLNDDEVEEIMKAIDISGNVRQMLSDPETHRKLLEKIRSLVEAEIESLGNRRSEGVVSSIVDSQTFKDTLDRVVQEMSRSGRVEEFCRGVVEKALKESGRFQSIIFDQIGTAVASRLAGTIVKNAFGG